VRLLPDDPTGYYRVLYASSRRLSCFIETLARFRPDLTLLAELEGIASEDDYLPLGQVPAEWCDARRLAKCTAHGSYADIYSAYWVCRFAPNLSIRMPETRARGSRCRYSPTRKTTPIDITLIT
jgi:hypothetical protein